VISIEALLHDFEEKDPKKLVFFQEISRALDRLNRSFVMDDKEPRVLTPDRKGYGYQRNKSLNILPEILQVKAIRFAEDRNNLLLRSADSMAARVYKNAVFAVPTGVHTPIPFDLERFDTDDMHDIAVNNTRLTIQHEGLYVIGGHVQFEPAAGGALRIAGVKFNGALSIGFQTSGPLAGAVVFLSVATLWQCVIGDYFELTAFQDTGGPINVANVQGYSSEFWAHRLS